MAKFLSRYFNAVFGLSILVVIGLVALFAPHIAPYEADRIFAGPRLSPPSAAYPFGTDALGRDMFSRVVHGARLTAYVGTIALVIGLGAGAVVGLAAGYSRTWLRGFLMRVIDLLYSFPGLLIALALVAFIGPSLENAMIAVGISTIPFFARVTYSVVIVERAKPYFDSGRVIGAGSLRLMVFYLLPNVLPALIVVGSLGFSTAILAAAGLSFLGLGAQPPAPEWGALLADGRSYMTNAPWLMIFPGLSIFLVVLAFNLVGDAMSEHFDPRQRWKR
ncbi:ABC transporter permease [Aminobacter aganoensis]|uniref:Peptide/nickel transport system permease protein n=1 Tax=Aminobacter aganoensis TaxID=83264 RepID=A0A7X0FCS4_9HYPH|nr:ABC transporter permease [Aminobacter aganoensis]MBB6357247.1 peptide/nickel transport system permease protein [Aminobacter aganoensis]